VLSLSGVEQTLKTLITDMCESELCFFMSVILRPSSNLLTAEAYASQQDESWCRVKQALAILLAVKTQIGDDDARTYTTLLMTITRYIK
jgi:hypothetical protein